MSFVVHKFPIVIDGDLVTIETAYDAEVLSIQLQHAKPVMWLLVNDQRAMATRYFRVVGTGHPLPGKCLVGGYAGTFQLADGNLVLHVFECGAP